ncbi:MAG TPA: DUF3606 domain-containing protein [Burkholderiales bacterium]|jgi:hypothetical protein
MYQEPPISEEAYTAEIDPTIEFEVTYWARRFRITKRSLRDLIARVGRRATDVRDALRVPQRRAA